MARAKRTTPARVGKDSKLVALNINVPQSLMDGLDAWVEKVRAGNPLHASLTRTDIIRAVLTRAIEEKGKAGELP